MTTSIVTALDGPPIYENIGCSTRAASNKSELYGLYEITKRRTPKIKKKNPKKIRPTIKLEQIDSSFRGIHLGQRLLLARLVRLARRTDKTTKWNK